MDMSTGTSDPTFADVLSSFEIVYHPLMMDKLEEDFLALTQVDICVVEGIAGDTVVATELLEHARNISTLLITLGNCASYGGVPGLNATKGLLNLYPVDQYVMSDGTLLQVDEKIPGCPPQPEHIVYVLTAGAMGEPIAAGKTCDKCVYDFSTKATELGTAGCKSNLGCVGDKATRICATTRSTGGVSPCTVCDDVCVGCYESSFPVTPFYK
jgi:coenzyme F420-reducing hydrogenase gamma subunit